jgi:hypothetical protein
MSPAKTDERQSAADPKDGQSAAAAPANPSGAAAPTYRYVERPDVAETFADSITAVFFDGQSLRLEFAVSRVDDVKPNAPIAGRRYPACRLVLTPTAAVELINRMQQIGAALTQAGVVKPAKPAGETTKTA